jgi:hypothetical protein
MVGDDSRVAELSSAAVLRREEGRRWRTSVFNLLRLVGTGAAAAAGLVRWGCCCWARHRVRGACGRGTARGGRVERRLRGREEKLGATRVEHKTAGAAGDDCFR